VAIITRAAVNIQTDLALSMPRVLFISFFSRSCKSLP
jgi:hypothetical protein